jgi:hypothetical protein
LAEISFNKRGCSRKRAQELMAAAVEDARQMLAEDDAP